MENNPDKDRGQNMPTPNQTPHQTTDSRHMGNNTNAPMPASTSPAQPGSAGKQHTETTQPAATPQTQATSTPGITPDQHRTDGARREQMNENQGSGDNKADGARENNENDPKRR